VSKRQNDAEMRRSNRSASRYFKNLRIITFFYQILENHRNAQAECNALLSFCQLMKMNASLATKSAVL